MPKNKGNREHRQFSGTGNIEIQDFVFGDDWLDIFGLQEEIDIKSSVAFLKYFSIFHEMKTGNVF